MGDAADVPQWPNEVSKCTLLPSISCHRSSNSCPLLQADTRTIFVNITPSDYFNSKPLLLALVDEHVVFFYSYLVETEVLELKMRKDLDRLDAQS